MNLPYLWATSMIEGDINPNYYKKVPNNFTAMVELTDFKERVLGKKVSLLHWIKDFRDANCKYYLGKKDSWPVICTMVSRVFNRSH